MPPERRIEASSPTEVVSPPLTEGTEPLEAPAREALPTGTVLASLAAGCPLMIVPTEFDKPDNARRVEASGAGLSLAPRRCTPRRLRAAVERLLSEPAFRLNAERLAKALARPGGGGRAAELLERLASRGVDREVRSTECAEVMR